MGAEDAERSTAASDRSTASRSLGRRVATIASALIGLASAGIMTAAMFWIGDYYRGTQLSQDEDGRHKLQELRATARNELQTYGWINQSDGVVRIPIDRAMQLLVKEDQREEPSPATSPGEPRPAK